VATLGYYVDGAISELKMDVALVLIAATALLSLAVDAFSRRLRRMLRIDALPTRLSAAATDQAPPLAGAAARLIAPSPARLVHAGHASLIANKGWECHVLHDDTP
jgi:hypothetical protein